MKGFDIMDNEKLNKYLDLIFRALEKSIAIVTISVGGFIIIVTLWSMTGF